MTFHLGTLPDFPWDTLVPARERAAEHDGGALDLTIGSPVDPTPALALEALAEAADAHGYPPVLGSTELLESIRGWMKRRRNVTSQTGIMLSLGSKETVALLPSMLGLGAGDRVGFPMAAYPTYDVGARLCGAEPVPVDADADLDQWPSDLALMWLNSPGNPHGHVLSRDKLKDIVAWAREHDILIASDECYAALCWEGSESPSILDDEVCGGDPTGLFMLYSLSKQSNLAGYRAAFMAGDAARIRQMIEFRKHAGFMVPGPVQHAMAVMLADDEHVDAQAAIYEARRAKLLGALDAAGLVNDPETVAGLYLWVSENPERAREAGRNPADAWTLVNALAELGIIVAPGTFYGPGGSHHVRVSLTASDAVIGAATERLSGLPELLDRSA